MDNHERSFIQGFSVAIAFIAVDHMQPILAADAMKAHGFTFEDLVEAGCEEYDLERLRTAWDDDDMTGIARGAQEVEDKFARVVQRRVNRLRKDAP